jgi:hypothetical protein
MARVDWIPIRGAEDYSSDSGVLGEHSMYAILRVIITLSYAQGLKKSAQLPVRHLSDEMFEALMGELTAFPLIL